jgi:hypothetical protein
MSPRPDQPFFPKLNSLTSRQERMADLVNDLIAANISFPTGSNGGRKAVIIALKATIRHFTEIREIGPRGLNTPLVKLLDALMALEEGETKPLLRAARKSGRPRMSHFDQSMVGHAVFVVRQLQKTGMSLHEAQDAVAKTMRSSGARKSRGRDPTITRRTIALWCQRVAEDVARRDIAAQACLLYESCDPIPSTLSPRERQGAYIEGLRAMIMRSSNSPSPNRFQNPLNPPS